MTRAIDRLAAAAPVFAALGDPTRLGIVARLCEAEPMRLAELVAASNAVAGNPARLEKTRILAELLQALTPEEVPVAVAFLAGRLRQGRLGLGHATLWEARENPREPAAPGLFDAPGVDAVHTADRDTVDHIDHRLGGLAVHAVDGRDAFLDDDLADARAFLDGLHLIAFFFVEFEDFVA